MGKDKMTLEEFLASVMEDRREKHQGMTLGRLKRLLDGYAPDAPIILSNGGYLDGDFDSYRGYYEDLAFDYSPIEIRHVATVQNFLNLIQKALEQGEMEGYKGGDYVITEETLIWIAHYGTTQGAEMIVDVMGANNAVLIITKEDDL